MENKISGNSMTVNLSTEVVEAIKDIQLYDGYHEIIASVEQFLIEQHSNDSLAAQTMNHIKALHVIYKLLIQINSKS